MERLVFFSFFTYQMYVSYNEEMKVIMKKLMKLHFNFINLTQFVIIQIFQFLDGRVIFVEYAKTKSQLHQGVKQDSNP